MFIIKPGLWNTVSHCELKRNKRLSEIFLSYLDSQTETWNDHDFGLKMFITTNQIKALSSVGNEYYINAMSFCKKVHDFAEILEQNWRGREQIALKCNVTYVDPEANNIIILTYFDEIFSIIYIP
jgi:hypothetical protein